MTTKKPKAKATVANGKPAKHATNGKVKLSKKAQAAIDMLDRWEKEGPSDEDGTWEEFKAALERNRAGGRKLFRD